MIPYIYGLRPQSVKDSFHMEHYVALPIPPKHRWALALFRYGVALLRIKPDMGWYGAKRPPAEECICYMCNNAVEEEYHAIFKCTLYSEERKSLMALMSHTVHSFDILGRDDQLRTVFFSQRPSNN